MVKNYKYNQLRKREEDVDDDQAENPLILGFENSCGYNSSNKRSRPKLMYFVYLSLLSWCLILTSQLLTSVSTISMLYSYGKEDEGIKSDQIVENVSVCSSVPKGTTCCDRSSFRSDICIMKGDVRTDSSSSSIFLYNDNDDNQSRLSEILQVEKIKPYTRKWEENSMNLVKELDLIVKKGNPHKCDVNHDVPALVFSTGGYTGNAYHDINDGILPLFITSQHLNKKVVFVILDYHNWWFTKYRDVLSQLSDYPVVNFHHKNRTHCFPEAIVGLRIHDELSLDPSLMERENVTIVDFRNLLDRAYWPRIKSSIKPKEEKKGNKLATLPSSNGTITENKKKPKLAIISRKGSREITNENLLIKMAEEMGFVVQVLRPDPFTELALLYRDLNSSDVMIGVHGAAMTYFLFMNPGSVFIQIIPLGLDWASMKYYEEPAVKLGLKYIGYKLVQKESSLFDEYDPNDPVLTDPDSVNSKGWEFTKKVYLDHQKVRLNLHRFKTRLLRAYYYSVAKKDSYLHLQLD